MFLYKLGNNKFHNVEDLSWKICIYEKIILQRSYFSICSCPESSSPVLSWFSTLLGASEHEGMSSSHIKVLRPSSPAENQYTQVLSHDGGIDVTAPPDHQTPILATKEEKVLYDCV